MLEYHINWILASFYYCYCQNSNFVCPFSPKGKHSVKGHKAVLSSKCFIKQTKVGCREGEGEQVVWKPKPHSWEMRRAGWLQTKTITTVGNGLIFWSGGKSLLVSCVIWLTSWLTALGYTTGLEYLCETHREAKTLMLIYYKCSIMKPSFVWVIRSWYTCIKLYWQVLSCLVQIRLET